MADFIVEFSLNQGELDEVDEVQRWVVNVDGLPRCMQEELKLYSNPRKEIS